ncbi:MazG nucleotide pyrophosphohydrolase domain-containing protein [Candidatus Poriferisodalis sp.]|uniref:MazG nucleotide pyrophosphohydrolase domain-containing protein n=1 Tax=Candidatus Poriferisodalis sp. TaxID=3101277 RepID=UPI003B52F901
MAAERRPDVQPEAEPAGDAVARAAREPVSKETGEQERETTGETSAGSASARRQPDLGPRLVSLHEVITRLRRECPWDRTQTHATLASYALDEASELAEALHAATEAQSGDAAQLAIAIEDLVEELGDVLLQVMMNAAIGEQAGTFTLAEVLETVEAKMLRRHPHVFLRDPDAPEPSDDALSAQWEAIKAAERAARADRIKARETRNS